MNFQIQVSQWSLYGLVILYLYYLYAVIPFERNLKRNVIFLAVETSILALCTYFGWMSLGLLAFVVVSVLFVYFYTEGFFFELWHKLLLPGLVLLLFSLLMDERIQQGGLFGIAHSRLLEMLSRSFSPWLIMLPLLLLLLSRHRGYLHFWNGALITCIYGAFLGLQGNWFNNRLQLFSHESVANGFLLLPTLLGLMIFILLEVTLVSYQKGYDRTTKDIREQMIGQRYDEIQAIYLNVRGWRHDYHNHLQVLKAAMDQGNHEKARAYLSEIESSLSRVDSHVKSGNLMADAILNSKLTLAEQKQIPVVCEVILPEKLFLADVDLCTILGNLLDNAIESCEALAVEQRFVRIYIAQKKEQLYLSIQNATQSQAPIAQDSFETPKSGEHGLGLRRVKVVIGKYKGYGKFVQQPGVFAAEISIPMLR